MTGLWNQDNDAGGGSSTAITAPLGRKADAASVSVALSTEDVALFPASLGAKTGAASFSIVPASDAVFPVAGSVAHDSPFTANPVPIGGYASNVVFTNVQQGDMVRAWFGLNGQQYVQIADAGGGPVLNYIPSDAKTAAVALATVTYVENFNGTNYDRQRGDVSGMVSQPFAMTGSRVQYAAASGGISNTTTAVTMFAAAGGVLRNYITGLQISSDALGAATELAIRDGAGGTVLWRMKVGMAGLVGGLTVTFPVPLKGTANTLMEVVTLTASVTGAVYVNAQGYTAI